MFCFWNTTGVRTNATVAAMCNIEQTINGGKVSVTFYVSWESLEDGVNEVMIGKGGSNCCIWIADNITTDGIRKLVVEAMRKECKG